MTWMGLDAVDVDDPLLNDDVADAVRAVRDLLATERPTFVEREAVRVDADPDYRAAFFSIPHSQDEFAIELRHGDGYSYLRSPIGDYDGFIEDEVFGEFMRAALHGRLIRVGRLRGGAEVEHSWRWFASDGTWHRLGRGYAWRSVWRLALPFGDAFEHVTFDFNRSPPVVHLADWRDAAP
jgi:hypothetical protein